jgi:hypothetical protein
MPPSARPHRRAHVSEVPIGDGLYEALSSRYMSLRRSRSTRGNAREHSARCRIHDAYRLLPGHTG